MTVMMLVMRDRLVKGWPGNVYGNDECYTLSNEVFWLRIPVLRANTAPFDFTTSMEPAAPTLLLTIAKSIPTLIV